MNDSVANGICLLAAYLAGAVPFAWLLGKMRGVDIRAVGSGNIGATNLFRMVSKPLGVLALVLDALKGFVPAFFFPLWAARAGIVPWEALGLWCGVAAVAGHTWPVYLGFKGGKGVATSAGCLLGVAPLAVAAGLGAWILTLAASRYVSLASIVAAAVVAAFAWLHPEGPRPLSPIVLSVLGALVIWRHRSNIRRLLDGTEHRFGKSKA